MTGTGTGTAQSFEELVIARAPALLRLALMLTTDPHDAEDLLQQTLLQAHRHSTELLRMAAPAAYLRRVMVNAFISGQRTKARRPRTVPLDDVDPIVPTGPSQDDTLWPLLQQLPRQQRAVLALRYYEDLTEAEIADVLRVSPGTVRSTASRGLAALRPDSRRHSMTSNDVTDDELAARLRQTYADHEHLASTVRAQELALNVADRPHRPAWQWL